MDFNNLIRIANKNEVQAEKKRSTLKPGLPPPSASKKEEKQAKGMSSATVRAVLAEQERRERKGTEKVKQKKSASTKDATSTPKAPLNKPSTADDDLDCDLKKLFNKNSKRVPHLPDSAIPNMLEVLKEKEKLRKLKEKEEEEERIQREKDLLREREKEREREREEKQRTHLQGSDRSSKHKHKSHHSDQKTSVSSMTVNGKSNTCCQPGQFKIPKKSQPPSMSYDDILALAAKKQNEPEAAAPAAPVANKLLAPSLNSEASRLMTQAEKDRWTRINSEEYQNWLKNGGPPPKHLPQNSKSKSSNIPERDKVSSASQPDRRKHVLEEHAGSRSDKGKISDKSQSHDRGHTLDRAGTSNGQVKTADRNQSNGQVKTADRNQSNGQVKQVSARSGASQLSSELSNRMETNGSQLSENQRRSKTADQVSGLKKDQKSSELNRPSKPSVKQKDLTVKIVSNEKKVEGCKSNPDVIKRPEDSQRLKSNYDDIGNKANSSGANSTAGRGSQKVELLKDFYMQCKKLKESGFLSDSLLKNLENELREKLKSVRKCDTSNASKSNLSGNNSRSSSVKISAKPSASHSQQTTSKVIPSNKVKDSPVVRRSSSLKGDEKKPDSKSQSAWDRICAENRQFKPKPNPAVKRRFEEEEEDEDDENDEDDEYDEDDDDMDSFIDDGEDEHGTDYSMYIRRLTNYDPTKYDDDFDDPNMETSYAQVLKEEAFSAREGRREDIEDMVMEEEENRRQLIKKKAGAKRARLS